MSSKGQEIIINEHVVEIHPDPTNLDLHKEQARQGIVLNGLSENVREIKDVLVGSDQRSGLVVDVDRLRRSRAMVNAVLWTVFTAIIGTAATALYAYVN